MLPALQPKGAFIYQVKVNTLVTSNPNENKAKKEGNAECTKLNRPNKTASSEMAGMTLHYFYAL